MQSGENFKKYIEPVADRLGAAIGASPRRRRRRLRAERLPGRPDRQGGRARALHRRRHLRRHPASRRHEGLARSSSPSTRTTRRRSSRSPTTASSPICSRRCRSSTPSCRRPGTRAHAGSDDRRTCRHGCSGENRRTSCKASQTRAPDHARSASSAPARWATASPMSSRSPATTSSLNDLEEGARRQGARRPSSKNMAPAGRARA